VRAMKRMTRIVPFVVVLAALGCSSGNKEGDPATTQLPDVNCATETVPTYSQVTLFQNNCVKCHSSTKKGAARMGEGTMLSDDQAPDDVNFDTYAAAKASALKAADELYEDARGAMPPEESGLPVASDTEKKQVLVWAKCGTPQ